jgi:hypothetical protein
LKLDLFNNKNKEPQKNFIQNFIQELTEALEKSNIKNEEKQNSIFNQVQIDKKVTAEYRDKMRVERNKILNDYAKSSSYKGDMYYIYDKNSMNEDTYNIYLCKLGESSKVIEVQAKDLPEGAGLDSVLRIENGKYILDNEATDNILDNLSEKFDELIEEQNNEIEKARIENHIYEVADISDNRVWLEDKTINSGVCFEETVFSEDNIRDLSVGEKFEYINGEYKKV